MYDNDIGDRFDNLTLIHRGQWAVSYKAFDSVLGAPVFLKVLNQIFHDDPEIIRRFSREVEIASSIKHHNVVKLTGTGEIGSSSYISFEWINGNPLDKFIVNPCIEIEEEQKDVENSRHLTITEVLDYAIQIFSGLSAIHEAGIIHRDIKPSNILVDEEGHIHVLDFSLAYAPADMSITPHDDILGTPGYLAPEVIAGGKESISSDLFSAGIVLYELLTNKTLFTAKDIYSTLQRVHEAEIINLTKIRKDVPSSFWMIIKKLLSKHPHDRYSSTEEVLTDLKLIELLVPASKKRTKTPGFRKKKPAYHIFGIPLLLILLIAGGFYIKNIFLSDNDSLVDHTDYETDSSTFREPESGDSIGKVKVADAYDLDQTEFSDMTTAESGYSDAEINNYLAGLAAEPGVNIESTDKAAEKELDAFTYSRESDSEVIKPEQSDPDSIKVSFDIYPWAHVYCDGNYLGATPILSEETVCSGIHEITFEHPDFPTFVKEYNLSGQEKSVLTVDLTSEFGRLDFAVDLWAYLLIDNDNKGTLPRVDPIYLEAGEHTIRIVHPEFDEFVRLISISPGEVKLVEVSFLQ